MFGDEEAMGRVLLVKATLAASEKRVGECIDNICEAQVSATHKKVLRVVIELLLDTLYVKRSTH